MKDKKRAFMNIYEVLKPGGRVVVLYETEIPPLVENIIKELNPEENYKKVKEMLFCEAKEKIESYCRDAGLVINESIEIKQRAVHENLSDYLVAVSSATHVAFDLDLIEEQNLKKLGQWIDKKGRVIQEFPIGIVLAEKALTVEQFDDLCNNNMWFS